MKHGYFEKLKFVAILFALVLLPLAAGSAAASGDVEDSYHGQMGLGTGLGMLEKWCALPNFSFAEQGGIDGWSDLSKRDCNDCHIGAFWNETKSTPKCNFCHFSEASPAEWVPTIAACMSCHKKDTAKRGDVFSDDNDVHIAAGFLCQDCHVRVDDGISDHQFLKGTAIDTTEPTMEGTLSCTSACHSEEPHNGNEKADKLNQHIAKVACETCHTGLRPGSALASRQWNVFTDQGKPVTTKREPGWLPKHKWYDNTGPGASGDYKLPILSYNERRDEPGAKIYPFNAVTVDWFVKNRKSAYDDIILVPEVKAADANGDGTVTVEEMRSINAYRKAELVSADMNFSINHSVVPKALAFDCNDCHGRNGWVLDWKELGYSGDPQGGGGNGGKGKKEK